MSLNYIKNKTGEILLFKTGRQPAHTEMQANEPLLPLDFQKNIAENTSHHLSGTGETDKEGTLFDGINSSDMQPNSEANSLYENESSSDEESDIDQDEVTNYGLSGMFG